MKATAPHSKCNHLATSACPGVQVWVHQAEDRKQAQLFGELPMHIRAEVAWAKTRTIMQRISVFQVQACLCAVSGLQTCNQAACWQGLPEALRRCSRSAHPALERAWRS